MGFEKHLSISYAHIDKQPLTPEQQGWISRLHASLKAMLSMRLGGPAEIWRDEKLHGNDVFAREIAALKKLAKPEREKPPEPAPTTDTRLIYLLCEEKDRQATGPLRKFCREQGWTVALPAFEGDATAVREANQTLLTTCDAVILFYGAGDDAWKRTMDNELKKMPGYRGGKPLLASYTYLADPRTSDKDDLLDMAEPHLIKGFGGFAEAEMATFVQAMSPRGGTT
jgi:hypothetical protein